MPFLTHPYLLPTLTASTALGALAVTASTYFNPHDAAHRYGILTTSTSRTWPPLKPVDVAAIRAHGMKYASLGLIIALLAGEHFRLSSSSGTGLASDVGVARGVRRALGGVLVGGSVVSWGDAWSCWGWNRGAGWTNVARGVVWIVVGGLCLGVST